VASKWLESLNDNVVALSRFYQQKKSKQQNCDEMVETIAAAVRAGKRVCAVFYGHPGIFVEPSHQLIQLLRIEGYCASMDPGVCTADCIFADLGLDPGKTGCMTLAAEQFMFYQHRLDPAFLVILWQLGGITVCAANSVKFNNITLGLQVLTEQLLAVYPHDHEVIIYEAATMAIMPARIEKVPLGSLPKCKPGMLSTLIIPSYQPLEYDQQILAKLDTVVK
jgi:hypothetical protein